MIVLDASIAIKWLVVDEPGRDAALRVLAEIEKSPEQYAVPELFFNEVVAVLCQRTTADAQTIQGHVRAIEQLGLQRIGNGHEVLETAVTLARAWSVSGYDAIYLATAEHLHCAWLTADKQAAKKVRRPRLVKVLA